jgi:hypothetical protein
METRGRGRLGERGKGRMEEEGEREEWGLPWANFCFISAFCLLNTCMSIGDATYWFMIGIVCWLDELSAVWDAQGKVRAEAHKIGGLAQGGGVGQSVSCMRVLIVCTVQEVIV